MDRLLARMERRLGRFAIEHLTYFIVGGMGLVFVLGMLKPGFSQALVLSLPRVKAGEVWRLLTYLFIPAERSPMWVLFSLWWMWMVGTNLEAEWGAFKFNVFYILGMLGTTLAAWITGDAVGNYFLNLSLFFAFATLFPNYELFLFFILRIKVKWLGLLSAGYVVYQFAQGDWVVRAAIVAATSNYFLFCGDRLLAFWRTRNVHVRQAARRESYRPPPEAAPTGGRTCAMCGATEDDGADIRVCSCAKCGGPRNLCLTHARSH